jgi:16S rRNA (cytidine1402-2'-O)-methyltransferase
MTGRLAVVATPIGNLGDLGDRARQRLADADVIACEDTRRTRSLLGHLGLSVPTLRRVDDHTESAEAERIVDLVREGRQVVLITDAGTPAISDPGQRVVDAVRDAGLEVEAVPGASAILAALVASGVRADRFCFEGFLPRKGPARAQRLADLADETRTSVIYEAPHRVRALVADLAECCDDSRQIALCRELTKLHEQVWRGPVADAGSFLDTTAPRGEYVIVLAGAGPAAPATDEQLVASLRAELAGGASRRDAVASVTDGFGVGRRRVYQLALGLDQPDTSS